MAPALDVDQSRIGVGFDHQVAPRWATYIALAYEKFDAGGGVDFDGYSAEVGMRGALAPSFEGYAMAGYEDFEQADGDFYGRLGAQVKFNPNWGVSGDVKFIDGDTQYLVGPRFAAGNRSTCTVCPRDRSLPREVAVESPAPAGLSLPPAAARSSASCKQFVILPPCLPAAPISEQEGFS